jgi:MSHA biogenesis protein MshQ
MVTALDAEGDATPNFGQESIAESVLLTSTLVAPAGGDDPGITPLTGFGPFSGGSATGTAFTWQQVGVITLLPSVGDGDYLGGGDVIGTTSGNIGRFVPHHFEVSGNMPAFSTQCTSGGFTYMGQDFDFALPPVVTFNAVSANGSVTSNYTGNFFKVTNGTVQNRTYTAAAGTLDTGGLPPATTDPAILDTGAGTGTLTFSAGSGLLFRHLSAEAPFDADISLGFDLVDSDGVTAPSNPVGFSTIDFDAGAAMRFGRVRLRNALGSELVNLALPMQAEYFVDTTTGFVVNTDDNCTVNVPLSLGNFTANLQAGETCVVDTGNPGDSGAGCAVAGPAGQRYRQPALGGEFNLYLQAPGAGNDGSLSVTGNVPDWLEFDWDAALPGTEDPVGIATFGIYDGDGKRIYTRELY